MNSLRIRFANGTIRVGLGSAAPRVQWMFQHLHPELTAEPAEIALDASHELVPALELLQAQTLRALADQSTTHIVLHGALLIRPDGVAIAFISPSGGGKSTLTAYLLSRGWSYCSDEAFAIEPVTRAVDAYARPVQLKSGASALAATWRVDTNDEHWCAWEEGAMAMPAAFGTHARPAQMPAAFVFFHYAKDDAPFFRPIGSAEATERLLLQTANPHMLAALGLRLAASLARSARCFEAGYSDLLSFEKALLEL